MFAFIKLRYIPLSTLYFKSPIAKYLFLSTINIKSTEETDEGIQDITWKGMEKC